MEPTMTDENDPLARAVERRRRTEAAAQDQERARARRARARSAAWDRELDEKRARLLEHARVADPLLRRWIDQRLDLALRAFPSAPTRSIALPALYLGGREPRFWHEDGPHRVARAHKRIVVWIGPELVLDWSASSFGGAGGDRLPTRPTSVSALAALDLRSALGPSMGWLEGDVLAVATRIAKLVADGKLETLVTGMIEGRFERGR
jgi:hypothetical protein